MKNTVKPILVTGAHRSGSTWVGRMLASTPNVGYIQEPLNLEHRPGICGAKFDYWFPYISSENASLYYEDIKDTIHFRYKFGKELQAVQSLKDFLRAVRDYKDFYTYRISNTRPLLKDPIAIFSAAWLASTFDMDVVVLIRHPAAFAASIKAKGWTFPFSHIAQQPRLVEEHFSVFAQDIDKYATVEHDIIDQACLLWNLIHLRISQYQAHHKTWIFKRHEDISLHPLREFQDMYTRLNLNFSEQVRDVISSHSDAKNPVNAAKYDPFLFLRRHLKRDSKANVFNWKKRLSKTEITTVREKTDKISKHFYSQEDWE